MARKKDITGPESSRAKRYKKPIHIVRELTGARSNSSVPTKDKNERCCWILRKKMHDELN